MGDEKEVHVARAHTWNCEEGAGSGCVPPLLITCFVAAAAGVADMLCSALPSETLGGPEVGACQACCCFPLLVFVLRGERRREARRGAAEREIARIFKGERRERARERRAAILRLVVHQYVAASPVYFFRCCRGQSSGGVCLPCCVFVSCVTSWTRREARVEELAADTRAPSPRRSELL